MKTLLSTFGVTLALALPLLGQGPSDEEIVRKMDHDVVVASYSGDAATLQRLFADDFVLITGTGRVVDKATFVGSANAVKIEPYEATEVKVRMFGDSAVVTGRIVQKYDVAKEHVEADLRYTDVYVKRDGKWQIVAGHASPVSMTRTPLTR